MRKKQFTNRDKTGKFALRGGAVRLIVSLLTAFLLALALVKGGEHVLSLIPNEPLASPLPDNYHPDWVVTPSERRSTTSSVIDHYLQKKGSPLYGLGAVFYDEAQKHGIHPYLLVAIAGKESSFGKRCKGFNPFGWNRGKTAFESWEKAIETLAGKLATLPAYKEWREDTKNIAQLALSYNPDTPREWTRGIKKFMEELKEFEFEI
jgi:hypothetical protein